MRILAGTIVYRRAVSWDSGDSNAAGSTVYKGSLAEEAVVRVELQYTNSYQTKDYYRSAKAAADYSFHYRNDVFINGRKADLAPSGQDAAGCQDHPSLTRMRQYDLFECSAKDFDS